MNQTIIRVMQDKLNNMIDSGDDYTKIYEMSVKLDSLIVQYYNEILKENDSK
ncbi:UNVERIFIED_CONTAM: Spo0E like sporulation regulatory protein [Acetivibrio alkalicellulosi]